MNRELSIGLASWIIQDGNYGDFAIGDRRRFALEFYSPSKLRKASEAELTLDQVDNELYAARARVVFAHPEVWVINCGILLYREEHSPRVAVGSYLHGTLHVGIDPFFYLEYLKNIPGIPNIFYDWEISGILRDATPRVTGLGITKRGPGPRIVVPVDRTDAWNDDGGHAEYVLRAKLLGPAA